MKPATEEFVRGDFGDATFTHNGSPYRFFRQDSLFMVEAPGPDGEPIRYQITYTFGSEPLQTILVDFGDGKLAGAEYCLGYGAKSGGLPWIPSRMYATETGCTGPAVP
ncbi:MAG: hypothetical protein U5K69_17680 [Balneolaceae bacterium]|nr:hypothetical protein [Balneolaceae bacterium]